MYRVKKSVVKNFFRDPILSEAFKIALPETERLFLAEYSSIEDKKLINNIFSNLKEKMNQ
jgi:hypothetical protein